MADARIPLIALLCLAGGCRTIQDQAPGLAEVGFKRAAATTVTARPTPSAERPAASRVGTAPHQIASPPQLIPLPATQGTQGWPVSAVRPVSHQQPAPLVVDPELLDAPPAPPETTTLTLDELESMAIAMNPALAEAQAQVEALQGKWLQVGLPPNPHIGYSGQQLGSHGEAEQQGVFLQQELVRGGKLRLDRAIVSREIEIAEQRLATLQQRVLTDVRLGYYDVLIAQRRREVTHELVEIANQSSETAAALFNAKEVSKIDVIRARIEAQTAALLDKNARNLHVAAWSRLAAVVGELSAEPTTLAGDLEAFSGQIDRDDALQRLLAESPEMAVLLTEIERARWAVDRSHAEPVPNVDVQAVMQSDNGTGSSNFNLQVSMPVPWLNRNQGGIQQAHAELVGAERAVQRLESHLKQRLATAYQQYASALNQVEDYSREEGILANSKTSLDLVGKGYEAGEIDYLDLLGAQRTNSQTNLAYIEALGQLWAAKIEIEGLLLKGSLD